MSAKDKSLFEFVQDDAVISDEKMSTKSIGYLHDAFIRFRKNKVNVVATSILLVLILLSFLVPAVSSKNYKVMDEFATNLPAKIPFLEKFGIFDGTVKKTEMTMDPVTGLPVGFSKESIKNGTLKTYYLPCSTENEYCLGGSVFFQNDGRAEDLFVSSKDIYEFARTDSPVVRVSFEQISEGTTVEVIVRNGLTNIVIAKITNAGTYDIAMFAEQSTPDYLTSGIHFNIKNNSKSHVGATFKSIQVRQGSNVVIEHKDYALAQYAVKSGTGSKLIQGASVLVADFTYLPYVAQYSDIVRIIPQSEYDDLAENNPAAIKEVKRVLGCVEIDEKGTFCNYEVVINVVAYRGYSSTPYFWFGTNSQGHDMFTKLFAGVKISLLIGLVAASINITVGVLYGAVSGYYGGKTDLVLSRLKEVMGGIPMIAILTVATLYYGPGLMTVLISICLTGWMGMSSITRTQFYRYKGREYVLASRTLGAKDKRLIFRHILPNGIGPLVTSGVLMIPGMIGLESMLSYLNLGLTDIPSIGVIMSQGQAAGLMSFPWLTLFPALIISILMITFNMFGLALRDALNPSLRGS